MKLTTTITITLAVLVTTPVTLLAAERSDSWLSGLQAATAGLVSATAAIEELDLTAATAVASESATDDAALGNDVLSGADDAIVADLELAGRLASVSSLAVATLSAVVVGNQIVMSAPASAQSNVIRETGNNSSGIYVMQQNHGQSVSLQQSIVIGDRTIASAH